jgi:hypothetical protein
MSWLEPDMTPLAVIEAIEKESLYAPPIFGAAI